MTTIQAKKDLFNNGKCLTKGKRYTVNGYINSEAGLMDAMVVSNDLGEPHIIGQWWRDFKIVK